jgi:hypothetical protein
MILRRCSVAKTGEFRDVPAHVELPRTMPATPSRLRLSYLVRTRLFHFILGMRVL